MNEYQKNQSLKILQSYSNDIEKGGKRAKIGEVRFTNNVPRVKHPDGWLYTRKDGSHYLVKNDGSKREGTGEDQLFVQKHLKEQQVSESGNAFRKEKKDKVPIQKQVGKRTSLNHSTITEADKLKSLTRHALKASRDVVNEIIDGAEKRFKENNVNFSPEDRALYKIGITYEMMNALAEYAKDSDEILGYEIQTNKDRVELKLKLERDGEEHVISNSVIEAGGHSVQTWHTRMKTTSTLPKNKDSSMNELLKNTKDDGLKSELQELNESYDAVKKISALKRQPLRFTGLVERYDSIKDNISKLPDDNNNFIYALVEEYSKNKSILSGYDSNFKEFLKKINSEAISTRSRANDKDINLRNLDALKSDHVERLFKAYVGNEGSLKESLLNSIDERKKEYVKESTFVPTNEINNIYKKSPLPFNLGKVSVLSSKLRYNKDDKTFTADRTLENALSNDYINYTNKKLTLYNPKTNKEELFEYIETSDRGYNFKSTNNLNLIIKKH